MFFNLIFRVGDQTGINRIFQDEFFDFCLKGRKCEDGTIDKKYPMVELDNDNYYYRTDKNVEFSDGVLIIQGDMTNDSGTKYTTDRAEELKKKLKIVNMFAMRKSNLLGADHQVKMVCKKFLNNIYDEILQNNGFLVYDSIRKFYTLGLEGSFLYFTAQEIFQKMREKCSNVKMVLLKEKSELIKILPIIRSDECLLISTKVNRVNMFEHNHLFERFKVKLEIEKPVRMSELKFCTEVLESCLNILADIDGSYTNSASISSKHNKLQNSQVFANRTRLDFTMQNYSDYEIFTLEIAGSLTNKIQKKIKNDFAKLSKQIQNNINYIVSQKKRKGHSIPKNFQIFGASTEGFDIVIKRIISVDRYIILQEFFIIEVPSSITDYYKLKNLIREVIALSTLIDQGLKVLKDNVK
ncbi:21514_t:CDS:2 [Racocetra persica]|uniref:21514_t:CDS:1 n=1 Tax=Racocetra persica TaxID=160502 RepID=A0ACA9K7J4_9GLOM|nr:21514_t:CDS:2 [Racocetra persica]